MWFYCIPVPVSYENPNTLPAGTRFQAAGHPGAAKDVAAEHEDQADRPGHHHCAHPYHHPVGMPRLQMLISDDEMGSFALLVVESLIILGDHRGFLMFALFVFMTGLSVV